MHLLRNKDRGVFYGAAPFAEPFSRTLMAISSGIGMILWQQTMKVKADRSSVVFVS
jgi:hypothetical protein